MNPTLPTEALDTDNSDFINAALRGLRKDENGIACSVSSDPNAAQPGEWKPIRCRPGVPLRLVRRNNNYLSVSSFRNAEDGSPRRRTDLFSRGFMLMIDDLVQKVPYELVASKLAPSAVMRTSPNSYQAWLFFDKPIESRELMSSIIKQFISKQLLNNDPGMAGVNRVGRLIGRNTKQKYGPNGFDTHFVIFEPERRYSPKAICEAFGLEYAANPVDPVIARARARLHEKLNEQARDDHRAADFNSIVQWMESIDGFKARQFNQGGWREISCPWIDTHTDRANTGAALGEPNVHNGFYGAFECHHGHCRERTFREFADWAANHCAGELNDAGDEWHTLVRRRED